MSEKTSISAICLTFARPQLLEEAIHSFLIQDYDGPKELIVLNTFLRQRLIGDFPNVRIINAEKRPSSLGACRNLAISQAKHDYIVIWDDDDVFLPWHLRNYAEAFADPNIFWAHQDTHYLALKHVIRNVTGSGNAALAFKRSTWVELGGYSNAVNSGEDTQFIGRLTQKFPGKPIVLTPERVSYVYCWATGSYHISGWGEDAAGKVTGYRKAEAEANKLLMQGRLKRGPIRLHPTWRRNYLAQAGKFCSSLSAAGVTVNNTMQQDEPPLIFHAVERHESLGAKELTRKKLSVQSWAILYREHDVIPCHYVRYKRDSSSIGDTRRLPFLRDVLKNALQRCGQNDIVMWTNDDTILHPQIADKLREHIAVHGAVTAIRCEFSAEQKISFRAPPEEWARQTANAHCSGRDLFAAQAQWLRDHFQYISDFVLGAPWFDYALAELVRRTHRGPNKTSSIGALSFPSELEMGYVGHVAHSPKWSRQVAASAFSNQYNERLHREFMACSFMTSDEIIPDPVAAEPAKPTNAFTVTPRNISDLVTAERVITDMWIVFPVCNKDAHLLVENLKWMHELDGPSRFRALLAHDNSLANSLKQRIKHALERAFPSHQEFCYPTPTTSKWPVAPNFAWQHTARHMMQHKVPWLWFEPDATAISTGWMDALFHAYQECDRLVMGPVVKGSGHINGVAIYDHTFIEYVPGVMTCTDIAWDAVWKPQVWALGHDASDIMQHAWGMQNGKLTQSGGFGGPQFNSVKALSLLLPTAVMFHRVKNTSLIRQLKAQKAQAK